MLSAFDPNAELALPRLRVSAWNPTAVLFDPTTLLVSVNEPTAVLLPPVVVSLRAEKPFAVLFVPVVKLTPALVPVLVFVCAPAVETDATARKTAPRQLLKVGRVW